MLSHKNRRLQSQCQLMQCVRNPTPFAFFYLYDHKFKHEVKFADVSWWEVKKERRIPRRTGGSFGFSAANHSSVMMQSDQYLEL